MNCAVLVVWSVLLLLPVYCGPGQPVGPDGTSTGQQGDCPAEVRIPIGRLATSLIVYFGGYAPVCDCGKGWGSMINTQ